MAFLGLSTPVTTTRRRLKGYRSAVADIGLDNSPDLICMPAESADEAAAELVKRLEAPNAPTAVFSANIPCTMALVQALKQADRTDIAVVGFGDFPMAAALTPAVTVVDQDPARLGHIAVERLLQRIEDPARRAAPPDRAPGSPDPPGIGRTASAIMTGHDQEGTTVSEPGTAPWRRAEASRLLAFGRGAALPDGGFGWLGDDGAVDRTQPCPLYINARMTHVFALAHLQGVAGADSLAASGLDAFASRYADRANGGWFSSVDRLRAGHRLRQGELRARARPAGGVQRDGGGDTRGRGRPRGRGGRHRAALLVRRGRLRGGVLER